MQFLCLFSFVVVASYAAALPQPAELSGKYSSNVNSDLASGLEARSYQPVVDTPNGFCTLMSLKRRDIPVNRPRTSSGKRSKEDGDSLSKGGGSYPKEGVAASPTEFVGDSLSKEVTNHLKKMTMIPKKMTNHLKKVTNRLKKMTNHLKKANESSEEDDESSEEGDESSEEDDESGTSPSTDTDF
ncbi:hypothetical protein BASA81_015229 [Batrachochytrium salamandrivorans]|nr:hypothetical protein BASA81_015229 [Batrachochytrium salamandrivorans]